MEQVKNSEVVVAGEATEKQEPKVNEIRYNPIFPVLMLEVMLDLPHEYMASDLIHMAEGKKNYDGGFTTYFDQKPMLDKVRNTTELKQAIYGIAATFGRELKYDMEYEKCSIALWGNVYSKGGHHPYHNHQRSVFSGTYFARMSDKMSPICFLNPTSIHRMHEPFVRVSDYTPFTAEQISIQPKPGTLLMWPSWLYHHVPTMEVEDHRVTFSFNVDYLPPGA